MNKTYIIAEMAWGHDGSKEQAIELVKEAKRSGADGISIHITNLPAYMVPYYGNGEGKVSAGREKLEVYKYLTEINISNKDWEEIAEVIEFEGLDLIVMPNDFVSLEFSEEKLKAEYYVISAASFIEEDFLREIARKHKKTIFRIGGAYLGEIEKAINIFHQESNNEIVLLHGFQNYPTKLEETNLALISTLKSLFGTSVGIADHIDGGNELAKIIPMLSIPYGATYIEKHITLDRNKRSEDFESALDPLGFKEMVRFIRTAEIAIGASAFNKLSEDTHRYRNVSRKRVVAAKDLEKGKIIAKDDICFKRSDIGLTPDKIDTIIGRELKIRMMKDDSIINEIFH